MQILKQELIDLYEGRINKCNKLLQELEENIINAETKQNLKIMVIEHINHLNYVIETLSK